MGPEQVTAAWIAEILGRDVGEISTERIGDGLVGLNVRVELREADPVLPQSLVLKLPSLDETSRATGVALRNYEREVKFYLEVAHTVDVRVPHCHHGEVDDASGDFVLVLEDMAPAEQGDQLTGCTLDEAHLAVQELAKLHGPRWNDPTLHDHEWLTRRSGPEDIAQIDGLWQMFFPAFAETYGKYLSAEAIELATKFGPEVGSWMDGRDGPQSITHGDYRLDNLLFGTAAGGPPVTAVDWQTPGHGSPIADLAYFCGAGLLPVERQQHERSLLATYTESLDSYGIDIDDTWLWEQYRRESFAGVVMAVVASQIVGESDRSEAMFSAMATRHLQHALDLDSLAVI